VSIDVGRVAAKSPQVMLTPREWDVVRGVASGRTNSEIANELGLSLQSVKNILSVVYQKCHVRNRLELAVLAFRYKLLSR
jgi:DNA-binding NarL/FixJ family response regulator